jgi:hypothetical protein
MDRPEENVEKCRFVCSEKSPGFLCAEIFKRLYVAVPIQRPEGLKAVDFNQDQQLGVPQTERNTHR